MPRVIPHIDTHHIIQKYHSGTPVKDIASELGVNITTIYDRINTAGALRNWRKPLDPALVASLYSNGMSIKKIGETLNTQHWEAIKKIIIDSGARIRGRAEQLRFNREKVAKEICESYKKGSSTKEISNSFGISVTTVLDILKKNNIPIRPRAISIDVNIITDMHSKGMSISQIAREFQVTSKVVERILTANNISYRKSLTEHSKFAAILKGFDEQTAIKMFSDGIGVRGVAERFDIPVSTVKTFFKEAGIKTRNRSQQQFARMATYSADEIKSLTKAANIAATGRIATTEEIIKRASTLYIKKSRQSAYEVELANLLTERGVAFDTQTQIGTYNCDLSIHPVAVEVWGGHWHWYGAHISNTEKRFNYIMNSGWHIIVIPVSQSFPLTSAVADNLIREINRLSVNPSAIREYRVIWGAGEFSTGGCLNDNNFSVKPPFTNRRNPTTGQYERVSR